MGTILSTCSIGAETRVKLETAEKENEDLKRRLIEAQERYKRKQQKIDQLYTEKTKATTDLIVEKKEKEELFDKYSKEKQRLLLIEDKNIQLSKENKKLKKQLVSTTNTTTTTQKEEKEDNTVMNGRQSTEPQPQPQEQEEEEEDEDVLLLFDIQKLRNWLIHANLKEKELKTELAKLLTARNESRRSQIPSAYKQRYRTDIMDDISKIIGKRGNIYELADGLFKTRSEFDAVCIEEIITNKNNRIGAAEIGQIICCRNINELQLISNEYKRLYGMDMKDKIYKMSSKKTYQNMINSIFTFSRNDNETTNKIKIAAKVSGDVEFLMDKNVKWKNSDNKQKLALMIVANNIDYIRDLNEKYFQHSQENLTDFIDNELGEKAISAQLMKTRIEYATDCYDFYARKIQVMGDDHWKPTKEINRIFISTFGNELEHIKTKFDQLNYGDGKKMIQWLNKACKYDRYAFFLTKMLQNCAKRS